MHNYLAATLVRKGPSRLHFSHIRRLSSSKISHINRMTRRKRRVGGEPNSSPTLTTNRCVQRSCWCPTLIGISGRSSPDSDECPHSDYPVRQRPGRRPGDQATRHNESPLPVYDAGMATDHDQHAVCAVPGRKAEVTASSSSACSCEAEAVTRGRCHPAVGVSLTGSRTVLSPKSATRSSRLLPGCLRSTVRG